jgi:hypothetical protein
MLDNDICSAPCSSPSSHRFLRPFLQINYWELHSRSAMS